MTKSIRQRFETFHKDNPQIWELFEKYALEAMRKGRTHFGAKMIGERIRWYTQIETSGGDYKLSNDFIAFYVRLFIVKYPEALEVFSLKKSEADYILEEGDERKRSAKFRGIWCLFEKFEPEQAEMF